MPSFKLYDKTQTWFGLTGQALPGGYLKFYAAGTTTPQVVYGERALTTNNGSTIALNASSRLVHECWANTANAYFVEVYDADNVKQGEVSYVEVPGGVGKVIPVPSSGEYLTGDGTNFLAVSLASKLLPDQTGHSNKILGTDGTTAAWVVRPVNGAAGVSDTASTATSIRIGTKLIQWGSGSAAATGTDFATASITFPTAFGANPHHIDVTVTNGASVNGTSLVADAYSGVSKTGCTIHFNNADRHFDGSSKLTSAINFTYIAVGTVA